MTLLNDFEQWTAWLWSWIDWIWAAGWVLAGVLAAHLIWWQRHTRLVERERQVREQITVLGNRQREARRQTEEIERREETLRRMEENLRRQTEQLMPQIEQIRQWLDHLSGEERAPAIENAALTGEFEAAIIQRPPELANSTLQ